KIEMDPVRRGHGILMERVIPYAKGHLLQSNIHIIAPGGSSFGLISHEGEEVGYVISGEIELFLGDKAYQLSAGDTFCFRSEIGHGYRNRGKSAARILFVNTPPTFASSRGSRDLNWSSVRSAKRTRVGGSNACSSCLTTNDTISCRSRSESTTRGPAANDWRFMSR